MEETNTLLQTPSHDQPTRMPGGLKILNWFNLIIPGIITGVISFVCIAYPEKIITFLNQVAIEKRTEIVSLTAKQLRETFILQIGIAVFFIITAVAIFKKQNWARRAILYYSFFIALLLCLNAMLNPAAIGAVLLNVIHPGICIWCLTGKKALRWFGLENKPDSAKKTCCI